MRYCCFVFCMVLSMIANIAQADPDNEIGFASGVLVHPMAEIGDRFSDSLAHHGKYLAVGAMNRSEGGIGSGRLYVFNIENNQLVHDIGLNDPGVFEEFGASVDIDDRYILVGAPSNSNVDVLVGAAFLYELDSGRLKHAFYAPSGRPFDQMGISVSLVGQYAIVGSPGRSYPSNDSSGIVHVFHTETGELLHTLFPRMDIPIIDFGSSVAGWGDYALIGAIRSEISTVRSGGALLYNLRTGEMLRTVVPEDSIQGDQCGWTVAIDESYIVLGCFGTNLDGQLQTGSAVVFGRVSGNQVHRLYAELPTGSDHFGRVALHEGRLLVGAPDAGYGTATLFDLESGTTIYTFHPVGTPHGGGDFGKSVSIDNRRVIIGTPEGRQNNIQSGFVYNYDISDACISDINGDGRFNYYDVSCFVEAFTIGSPDADLNLDGSVDNFDLTSFLAISIYNCN